MFMCDVEEITDLHGEELIEEIELCAKTEAEELEEQQEHLKLFTTNFTPLAFRDSAAGLTRCGKYTVYCVSIAERSKSLWRCCGFYRQLYEKEEENNYDNNKSKRKRRRRKRRRRYATIQIFLDIFLQKRDTQQIMPSPQ